MSTLSVFDVSIDVLLLFISQLHSWRLINDLNKTFSINQNGKILSSLHHDFSTFFFEHYNFVYKVFIFEIIFLLSVTGHSC